MIEDTANMLAPDEMPTKSGEASGLPSSFWNSSPDTPRAKPTARPAVAVGSRRSRTMKSTDGSSRRWNAEVTTSHAGT